MSSAAGGIVDQSAERGEAAPSSVPPRDPIDAFAWRGTCLGALRSGRGRGAARVPPPNQPLAGARRPSPGKRNRVRQDAF